MPYPLCLFDLDGTLTDPKTGITNSFHYALNHFGIRETLETLTGYIGPPLRKSFARYDVDIELAVDKYREYYTQSGMLENKLYDGILETLQAFSEQSVLLAVATSKVTAYARQILEYFKLDHYFSHISGDFMDGSLTQNGKADVIRCALDALDPKRKMAACMIGDRKHDILGAISCGVTPVAALWGYGSREELARAGAKTFMNYPQELLSLLR